MTQAMIGIIGGTGLTTLSGLAIQDTRWIDTQYGEPSAAISIGDYHGFNLAFLARHGDPHQIPPHLINYRANIMALKQVGVSHIIAVNAVGGIHPSLGPAEIAIPDQIIDYTHGRIHTYYDDSSKNLEHVDFSFPYSRTIRKCLLDAAESESLSVLNTAVYGATQGPRLETAAEIRKYRQDGCDMVGMTGMPEAALARELSMEYACLALSVNWAAGITPEIITMAEIEAAIDTGMSKVRTILENALQRLAADLR